MDATTNDECKKYGIPRIFYHGPGADSYVLVMPLYPISLNKLKLKLWKVNVTMESWLSAMQQMVCIIYYDILRNVIVKCICFVFRLSR